MAKTFGQVDEYCLSNEGSAETKPLDRLDILLSFFRQVGRLGRGCCGRMEFLV